MKNIFIIIFIIIFPSFTFAASTNCPLHTIILDGFSNMPGGVTYNSHMELEKVNPGSGINGKWKIVEFTQKNQYPHNLKVSVHTNEKVDFKNGYWMQCKTDMAGHTMNSHCSGGNAILDIKNGKIGSLKTGVWIGQVTGNTASLNFDKSNPYSPVLKGTVHQISSGKISLEIDLPQKDYVYSTNDPAKLTMTAKAKATPAKYNNEITWTLPKIGSSTSTVTPSNAKGQNIQIDYENMPTQNSDFGKKSITATLTVGSCQVSDSKEIRIFFPRDVKNNPKGAEPNWFYYWSQTSAKKGPAKFGGTAGVCASAENRTDGAVGYYRHVRLDKHYYICDLSKLGASFKFNTVQWVGNQLKPKEVTGIDTFAAASYHENGHYTHFKKWWFAHKAPYPYDTSIDFNKNCIKDSTESALDTDKDLLPDGKEVALGFDPGDKYTYNGPDDDEEILAWKDEAEWVIGSANKEDWAKPGKQWP